MCVGFTFSVIHLIRLFTSFATLYYEEQYRIRRECAPSVTVSAESRLEISDRDNGPLASWLACKSLARGHVFTVLHPGCTRV
jgi:hypothetical protein